MKIGIIKERKSPPDRRVVFPPDILAKALQTFDTLEAVVEPSDIRIFPDQAYADKNISLSDDLTDCDVLVGVKEVPVEALIPNKTYFSSRIPLKNKSITEIFSKRVWLKIFA